VVGLLIGEVVSTKKNHIFAKDVVGLLVGDSKNDSQEEKKLNCLCVCLSVCLCK
jgi:hypothetical protein